MVILLAMVDAVLLTCHGTIESLDDLPAFLTNVRRGRPAPAELVTEVRRRYEAIGGVSPLMAISREQARLLEERLSLPVHVAGRLWRPTPREVLSELKGLGKTRVLSLPLAPQSVHVYNASVSEAAAELGMSIVAAPAWGLQPGLIEAAVSGIVQTVGDAQLAPSKIPVVLTAHSLPLRVLAAGDPYERDFRQMTDAIAGPLRALGHRVLVGFQSQGATDDAWLGPSLEQLLDELREQGEQSVLVSPVGFLAEHVETLYDLDIEARARAERLGLRWYRAPAVGTSPQVIDALLAVAREALSATAG